MMGIVELSGRKFLCLLAFLSSICLHFIPGYSDELSTSKNTEMTDHTPPANGKGSTIAVICLLLVAMGILSFFLFKIYQKKKRDEQYARLLKLFEEDDELEVELGLRD